MIIQVTKKMALGAFLGAVLLTAGVLYYAFSAQLVLGTAEESAEESVEESSEESTAVSETSDTEEEAASGSDISEAVSENLIAVHVSGQVEGADKVYYLPEGSRVEDAVNAAGPVLKNGDLSSLNLAEPVTDGEKIYVPKKGETTQQSDSGSESSSTAESSETGGLVNINTATQEELMSLSGIGETYAKRILEYREENGAFASKEDLMNVSGIGEATYAKIEADITV